MTLDHGCMFLIMGNAGFISSTVGSTVWVLGQGFRIAELQYQEPVVSLQEQACSERLLPGPFGGWNRTLNPKP